MAIAAAETRSHDPQRADKDFILLIEPSRRADLIALANLLLLLVLMRWHTMANLASEYLGGAQGDAGLYIWLTQSNLRDLFTLPWFNTTAFYPYTRSLAWSDNYILPAFAIGALKFLGCSLVVATNLILLGANLLNGYLTHRLCFGLTGRLMPSLFAGCAFMSFAYLTGHVGHPQLQFAFWLPLTIILLLRFFAKPILRRSFHLGLCITGAFLCTAYYAVFGALLVFCFILAIAIMRPHQLLVRQWLLFASGIVLGCTPLIAVIRPYLDVMSAFGERQMYEAFYFAATALSYLSSTPFNMVYLGSSSWTHSEANLFPGIAVLILAGMAIWRMRDAKQLYLPAAICISSFILACIATIPSLPTPVARYVAAAFSWISLIGLVWWIWRLGVLERARGFFILTNRALVAIFVFAALIFFMLSLGPLGNPEKDQLALGIYTPFYFAFPGVNSIRAVGRYGIVCVLMLVVLSALTINFLISKRRIKIEYFSFLIALVILENYSPVYPSDPLPAPSSVYNYLAQQPRSTDAMIVLPLTSSLTEDGQVASWGDFARLNVASMLASFEAMRPLVNGHSGQKTKLMREYPKLLANFPEARSIAALTRIAGLRYIVYASANVAKFDREEFAKQIEMAANSVTFLQTDEAGNYLFELNAQTRLTEDFSLLLPSYPTGSLYIDLVAQYDNRIPKVILDVFLPDHFGDTAIHSVSLSANGEPVLATLPIPETSDRVRPLRMTFRRRDPPMPEVAAVVVPTPQPAAAKGKTKKKVVAQLPATKVDAIEIAPAVVMRRSRFEAAR